MRKGLSLCRGSTEIISLGQGAAEKLVNMYIMHADMDKSEFEKMVEISTYCIIVIGAWQSCDFHIACTCMHDKLKTSNHVTMLQLSTNGTRYT